VNTPTWAARAAAFFVLLSPAGALRAAVQIGDALPPASAGDFSIVPSTSQQASDRGQTVGDMIDPATGVHHAVEWDGSTNSAIDLNPFGFATSSAIGTDGTQQVGEGLPTASQNDHALLWRGTAASAIDLDPAGFSDSIANGTNGKFQVGEGFGPRHRRLPARPPLAQQGNLRHRSQSHKDLGHPQFLRIGNRRLAGGGLRRWPQP
jgi:hypothetical protein